MDPENSLKSTPITLDEIKELNGDIIKVLDKSKDPIQLTKMLKTLLNK
jgi:hypothetical protein